MTRDPEIVEAVKRCIDMLGLRNLVVKDIQSKLAQMNLPRVPGYGTVRTIMKSHLELRFWA